MYINNMYYCELADQLLPQQSGSMKEQDSISPEMQQWIDEDPGEGSDELDEARLILREVQQLLLRGRLLQSTIEIAEPNAQDAQDFLLFQSAAGDLRSTAINAIQTQYEIDHVDGLEETDTAILDTLDEISNVITALQTALLPWNQSST